MQDDLLRFLAEKSLMRFEEVDEHTCSYCGVMTKYPDKYCFKAPPIEEAEDTLDIRS